VLAWHEPHLPFLNEHLTGDHWLNHINWEGSGISNTLKSEDVQDKGLFMELDGKGFLEGQLRPSGTFFCFRRPET
jgi:hypothetical protein